MFFIVSYDIPDTKRRTKLSRALEDFGTRVQYSVFECLLPDEVVKKMRSRIEKIIEPSQDRVRIYRLCAQCEREITILGHGEITKDKDVYIV